MVVRALMALKFLFISFFFFDFYLFFIFYFLFVFRYFISGRGRAVGNEKSSKFDLKDSRRRPEFEIFAAMKGAAVRSESSRS